MQIIPCDPTLTDYEMRCVLGDDRRAFWLHFTWNPREGEWYLDLYTNTRDLIRGSIKLNAGSWLGWRAATRDRPAGSFYVFDTSGKQVNPGIADLGARVLLVFFSLAEINAMLAGQTTPPVTGA